MNIPPHLDENSMISLTENPSLEKAYLPKVPYFELKFIKPKIHLLQPNYMGYSESNMVVIEMENGVVLIDPFLSPQINEILFKTLETHLKKPIISVINSHCHFDHLLGFININDATSIISGPALFKKMQEEGIQIIRDWVQEIGESYEEIIQEFVSTEKEDALIRLEQDLELYHLLKKPNFQYRLPNLLVSEKLQINDNNFEISIENIGSAYTEEDIIVCIQDYGIVFLGAILCPNCLNKEKFDDYFNSAVNPERILEIIDNLIESEYSEYQQFIGSQGAIWTEKELMEFRNLLVDKFDKINTNTNVRKTSKNSVRLKI